MKEHTFKHDVGINRDELYWFFADVYKDHCQRYDLTPPQELDEWFDLDHAIQSATEKGAIIRFHNRHQRLIAAAIIFKSETFSTSNEIMLEVMAVDADFQSQGVGRQLMQQIAQEAHQLGGKRVSGLIPEQFSTSIPFFNIIGIDVKRDEFYFELA